MANQNSKIARVDVLIGGADQARKQVEDMRKQWASLGRDVAEAQKQMEKSVDTVDYDKNKKKYTDALKEQKQVQKAIMETERNISTVEKYLSDVSGQTLRNLNQGKKALSQMLLGINPKNLKSLDTVREYIKQMADEAKRRKGDLVEFSDVIGDIGGVSDKSLGMAKQRLQDLVASTKLNTQEMARYRSELAQVEAEEQRRISAKAQTTLGKVQAGTFSGTIGETKEAIKQLEQFKQQLKTSDVTGIKQVDDAILLLNANLKQASTAALSYDQAIEQAAQVKSGNFQGTYEDLERLKKTLQEYKSQLQVGDTRGLEDIQNAFRGIEEAERKAKQEAVDIDNVMKNLKTVPMNDLKIAAQQLQEELNAATQGTEEFITKSAQLRQVNTQIENVNKQWKEHDNAVVRVIKRLTAYVLVYAGFNELWSKVKQLTQANLDLSDSLANIQKATGLSAESVAELSREIDGIDTRESQQALHDLAFEAGKLGLTSQSDIIGFVKAGNEVITALGDELGGAEAVRGLMKINDLLGETKRLGVEKALKATGSSINELANTSTASAGPIADIISRIGSVGAQAKLTMPDLAALGATADALGQEVEVSGTAISKFITSLQTNTRGIAQAVGVNDEELQKLMDAGKTMEAMILVLERTKGLGGLKEIAPLMKEFGSDGERLNRVITALASNVDVLKTQVNTSRTAFQEATSVTKEYNVMNESAMALVSRLGNTLMEAFVNSKFVAAIKSVLLFFMDMPNWIERNRAAFVAFKIVLAEILLLMASNYWSLFLTTLKSIGAFVVGPFIAGWRALSFEFALAKERLVAAGVATTGLTGKLRVLWATMKANPAGIILTLLATIGVAMYELATHVSEADKALNEMKETLEEERYQLGALKTKIDEANEATGERKTLIAQMNSQYGTYLGYMLDEKASADQITKAYRLINAELERKSRLEAKGEAQKAVRGKYATPKVSAVSDLKSQLESNYGITGAQQADMAQYISELVQETELNAQQIIERLETKYGKERSFGKKVWDTIFQNDKQTGVSPNDLIPIINQYKSTLKQESKELEDVATTFDSEIEVWSKKSITERRKILDEWTHSLFTPDALKNVEQSKEDIQRYIELNNQQLNSLKDVGQAQTQRYTTVANNITFAKKKLEQISKGTTQLNVWGEALTFEEKSAAQLIEEYKKLNKERNTMKEDADYSTLYKGQYKNRTEALQSFMAELSKIKKRLKDEFGVDLSGNPLKEKDESSRKVSFGGATKTVKEINDESTAALSALEAYYNNEKEMIVRSYTDRQITEEEMNRQTMKKEEEFLTDRIALRRRLLGKQGGENFDQAKYVQTSPETGETTDYFKGKNLSQLQGFINKMGQRMTDGMLQKLTEDELKIMQKAAEHMAKIQKIILDNDFTGQVEKQYQDELEALELFWGKEEDVTVESGDKRLAYLKMLSKDSYQMDADGLQQRMSKLSEFGEWTKGRTAEDYQVLLLMLQKFYDDTEEAENKELERKKRIANKGWEKSGQKASWNATDVQDQANVGFMKNLNEVGLASDSMVDDAEVLMYQNRLAAAQSYYDYMLQSGSDVTDAEQKRNEAMMELSNKEVEITKSKLQTLKQYTDAVVDFSEQMGEAAFGEVKDRQAAGKQLLKTTMQLTKNLIMEKVKELIMKKALGMQDVGITQATESTKSIVQGTGAITDLTVQGAKTAGDVALGTTSGAAKTIGQLGWWGIPLIAVIGAALSALMGMAMGKMNKAKEEIAATTGASNKGKVAAGMLTYADGDYPVLGNDGKVYNAAYQKDLKTGVYGGGAHFGIFSEKKPEMIVDGDTTQRIMFNYPQVYESIMTIARNGRMKSAMPTYADGNYPSMVSPVSGLPTGTTGIDAGSAQVSEILSGLSETMAALNSRLNQPINAVVDPYGTKGAVNSLNKANKFMSKRNLIK